MGRMRSFGFNSKGGSGFSTSWLTILAFCMILARACASTPINFSQLTTRALSSLRRRNFLFLRVIQEEAMYGASVLGRQQNVSRHELIKWDLDFFDAVIAFKREHLTSMTLTNVVDQIQGPERKARGSNEAKLSELDGTLQNLASEKARVPLEEAEWIFRHALFGDRAAAYVTRGSQLSDSDASGAESDTDQSSDRASLRPDMNSAAAAIAAAEARRSHNPGYTIEGDDSGEGEDNVDGEEGPPELAEAVYSASVKEIARARAAQMNRPVLTRPVPEGKAGRKDLTTREDRLKFSRDRSARCIYGGICGGRDACAGSDPLGCIQDPADRRAYVVAAMQWAWRSYRDWAYGFDEFEPSSLEGKDWLLMGTMAVDSLDTILLMGREFDVDAEINEAGGWVAELLDPAAGDAMVNLFETNIRVVGGLLGSFALTGNPQFLDKAAEVWYRLQPAFDTPTKIPLSDVNLMTGEIRNPEWLSASSLAEIATLTIEARFLSRMLESPLVESRSRGCVDYVLGLRPGTLRQIYIDTERGATYGRVTMGGRGDSYYEYLLKYFVQTAKSEPAFEKAYLDFMIQLRLHLLDFADPTPPFTSDAKRRSLYSDPKPLLFVHELGVNEPDTVSASAGLLQEFEGSEAYAPYSAMGLAIEDGVSFKDLTDLGFRLDSRVAGLKPGSDAPPNMTVEDPEEGGIFSDAAWVLGKIKDMLKATTGATVVPEPNRASDIPRVPKMDHLACFLPGAIALGLLNGVEARPDPEQLLHAACPPKMPAHECAILRARQLYFFEMSDREIAVELMRTCNELYVRSPLGLAPEIVYFRYSTKYWEEEAVRRGLLVRPSATEKARVRERQGGEPVCNIPSLYMYAMHYDLFRASIMSYTAYKELLTTGNVNNAYDTGDFVVHIQDSHYLLRPETIESLYLMYKLTGNDTYRDAGWDIFRAIELHTRLPQGGYTSVDSVLAVPPTHVERNRMETFFIAETLKYAYLLQGGDEAARLPPPQEVVFNTEAHAFPVEGSAWEAELRHMLHHSPEGQLVVQKWGFSELWDGSCPLNSMCYEQHMRRSARSPRPTPGDPKAGLAGEIAAEAGAGAEGNNVSYKYVVEDEGNLGELLDPEHVTEGLLDHLRKKWEALITRISLLSGSKASWTDANGKTAEERVRSREWKRILGLQRETEKRAEEKRKQAMEDSLDPDEIP